MMRFWFALFLSAPLCLGIAACGDTGKSRPSTSQAKLSASGESPATTGSITTSTEGFLNDGDTEKKNDVDADADNRTANQKDTDADGKNEYEASYNSANYQDYDDSTILSYGHAASASDARAIAAIVERYYSAAATGKGAITVTDVRVKGDRAYAFIGSRTMPASYIVVRRGAGGWKLSALRGKALP
jgi:hypothetical protein